ncbi:MAG: hydrogen peroxide-inducible genes activator [Gammaproteobacteria bacterium]
MTLTELRYIIAVAREKHFGKAAQLCFVSQPTLSVAVRKLEETLGIDIFERAKNEIRLTPIGEKIVAQAQRVLDEVTIIKSLAKQGQDELTGPLRIGAIYTIGPYLFPYIIPRLHELAPQMPLIIEENFTAVLRERLSNGQLDVIIISLPFTGGGLQTISLYTEEFLILLPSEHRLAKYKAISAEKLNDENMMLLGEGHCFREQVLSACPGCVQPPSDAIADIVEGSSLETIRHMVATGMGITVVPQLASTQPYYHPNVLLTRPFTNPVPVRQVALAWRKSFPRPKVLSIIQQAIQSCGLQGVKFEPM